MWGIFFTIFSMSILSPHFGLTLSSEAPFIKHVHEYTNLWSYLFRLLFKDYYFVDFYTLYVHNLFKMKLLPHFWYFIETIIYYISIHYTCIIYWKFIYDSKFFEQSLDFRRQHNNIVCTNFHSCISSFIHIWNDLHMK